MDGAYQGRGIFHQSNVDGEFTVTADELLGAVQGVDEKKGRAFDLRHAPFGHALLCNHRNLGRDLGQRLEDQLLGTLVGLRDRSRVALGADVEAGTVDGEDFSPGALGNLHQRRAQTVQRRSIHAHLIFRR